MSNDQDRDDGPPNFGSDDENTGNDSSMYVSTISPDQAGALGGGDDDDEEENPFGLPPPAPSRHKSSTNTTNTVESPTVYPEASSAVKLDDDDDDDVFGVNKKTNSAAPLSISTPVPDPQPSSPIKQESALYENLNTSSPQPTTFNSQVSSSTPVSNNETTTESKPVRKRNDDDTIEITVSDPTKVGDVSLIIIISFNYSEFSF